MAYGADDTWRVWSDLRRKEDELKWDGPHPNTGHHYDSMGRVADASRYSGWGHEMTGRVDRVRQALRESGDLARSMIARRLSGINLSTIWHILISACEDIALIYGGSVVAGGLVGGLGGALFGGVGAVPGAAAGAAAGSQVGGWVLGMLGLKSLAEGVAHAIPEALKYYERGFREAWGPTRHDHQQNFGASTGGNPSSAAFHFANGHVIMVTAILAVLVAYLTRGKGDKAVLLEDIRKSRRLGPKVATWVEQNEDSMRNQPMLRPSGGAGMALEEPPLRARPQTLITNSQRALDNSKNNGPTFSTGSTAGISPEKLAPDSKIYVTPGGTSIVAPAGYTGVTAQNGKGLVLLPEGQGLGDNRNIVRYGDPTTAYLDGYFRYYNHKAQPLNPATGQPGPNSVTHIPQGYQGPLNGYPGEK